MLVGDLVGNFLLGFIAVILVYIMHYTHRIAKAVEKKEKK